MIEHLRKTATVFELWWTFPAAIGLFEWVGILYLVSGDALFWHSNREEVRGRDVKPEKSWAEGQLAQKFIMLLVLVIIVAFGMVAMWSPPSVQPPPPPTRVTYMLTFTFISIPTLLMIYGAIYLVSRTRTKHADDERTAKQRRRRTDVTPTEGIAQQLDRERPG